MMPSDLAPTVRRTGGCEAMSKQSIRLVVLLVGVLLVAAGCQNQTSSDNAERRGGFYTGVAGGWSRP